MWFSWLLLHVLTCTHHSYVRSECRKMNVNFEDFCSNSLLQSTVSFSAHTHTLMPHVLSFLFVISDRISHWQRLNNILITQRSYYCEAVVSADRFSHRALSTQRLTLQPRKVMYEKLKWILCTVKIMLFAFCCGWCWSACCHSTGRWQICGAA